MTRLHRLQLLLPSLALTLAACDSADDLANDTMGDTTGDPAACDEADIALPGEAFYPEGVAAVGDTLFVGSIATGEVVRANTCDGSVETFIEAGAIPGAVGLRADEAHDLLWVCASDSTQQLAPSLEAFDLETGVHRASHSFASPGLCNDIALDGAGNVYATDSFGHRIVRVVADDLLLQTDVETWATDPAFAVPAGEFGLNGIVWQDDALVVAVYADGRLLEVPIEADGSAGTPVVLGAPGSLMGPDGLLPHDEGLLVVEGFAARLSQLDPQTVQVTPLAEGLDFPTTVAVTEGAAWVAQGQFDHLYGLDPAPPSLPFMVRRVPLR